MTIPSSMFADIARAVVPGMRELIDEINERADEPKGWSTFTLVTVAVIIGTLAFIVGDTHGSSQAFNAISEGTESVSCGEQV